jgi:hypothetical protein
MSRSFDRVADHPDSVEKVLRALADEQYWLAWLADCGADDATLDSMRVGADGSVEVASTQTLRHDRLPGIVAQFYKGDLQIKREESWSAISDGKTTCIITGSMPGIPVEMSGTGHLTPHPADVDAAQLRVQASVEVRIPVLGGKIEKVIGNQLMDMVTTRRHFTNEWISENS